MYHLICLSRGIVPERIILRRTVSHCQKETENKEKAAEKVGTLKDKDVSRENVPNNTDNETGVAKSNFDAPEVDQALTMTTEISKIEISKLTPTIAEKSVISLAQVNCQR